MTRDHQGAAAIARKIALAVIGIVLVAGCATAQPDPNSHLGAEALENLSPFEQHVLADKKVTDAERDQAVQVFTDCLVDAGITYQIQPGQSGLSSVLMYGSITADTDRTTQLADHDAKVDHCVDQVNAVENVWILQNPGKASGAQPLPGLKEALDGLDTSAW